MFTLHQNLLKILLKTPSSQVYYVEVFLPIQGIFWKKKIRVTFDKNTPAAQNCTMIPDCPCGLCKRPQRVEVSFPSRAQPVYVFLDMDGVMIDRYSHNPSAIVNNTKIEETFKKITEQHPHYSFDLRSRLAQIQHLDRKALKNLRSLIDKIEATRPVRIVLSSAWACDATLDQLDQGFFQTDSTRYLADRLVGKVPSAARHYLPSKELAMQFTKEAKGVGLDLEVKAHRIQCWLWLHSMRCREDLGLTPVDFVVLDDFDEGFSTNLKEHFVHVDGGELLEERHVELALHVLKLHK